MPQFDPAIVEALGKMAAEDPQRANLAGTALTWVTGGGGAGRITQERVQRFLWYDLPIKLRPTAEGRAAIAGALSSALDHLGLPRYAQICRSEDTARVFEAYARDPKAGLEAFRQANLASGIYPPDLPEFSWAPAMGAEEAKALAGVQDYLELAVASGELVPGAPNWKRKQRRLVRKYLTSPNFQLGGQTPLDVMNTERIQNWINLEQSETRQRLLSDLANRLLHPADLPGEVADPYPDLTALLRRASEAGGLEPGTEPLESVALSARYLRKLKGRLVLTRRGKQALEDPRAAWTRIPESLLKGNPYQRLAGEMMLALLLKSETTLAEVLAAVSKAAAEANYRERGTGQPPSEASVLQALEPTLGPMRLLGLITEASGTLRLTGYGRAVALQAIRTRATGPAAVPWT